MCVWICVSEKMHENLAKYMKLYSSVYTGLVWSIVGAVMKVGKYWF